MRWWALLASSIVAVVVVGAVAHWKGQRDALGRHPGSNASLSSLDGAANEESPVSDSKATPRADPARPFFKTDSGKSAASEGERRVQFAQQGSGPRYSSPAGASALQCHGTLRWSAKGAA